MALSVYTRCTKRNYKIVPETNFNKIYTMVQVEMSNMYIDMGVSNGSEKGKGKNTAAFQMFC